LSPHVVADSSTIETTDMIETTDAHTTPLEQSKPNAIMERSTIELVPEIVTDIEANEEFKVF
jgi:hypothetical protein